MYPSPNEPPKYSVEGHPGHHVPTSGYPNPMTSSVQAVAPPYPASNFQPHAAAGKWSTNLCHCCDDPANCIITCFCPCITFGQISEIVDRGSTNCAANGTVYGLLAMTGFACLYSCFYRSRLRGQYDLAEDPCVDCLVHFFCEACALCQEYRELRNRGYDMGIGWEANVDRQKRGVMVPPVMGQSMTR
ncbi:protein PLANT CADMIUM RESISTANCE 2 [Eucalyptus grandis]|uniref:protein PLANT CADMIUM RESISTANCE 2 n=1 Tax=Eucalyptus grandis TaxID=71139 RepID=UPI00192EBCFC|nr:protein PLANT CADMIUM RESISTANCE 2 [Eucalyptus grandis]